MIIDNVQALWSGTMFSLNQQWSPSLSWSVVLQISSILPRSGSTSGKHDGLYSASWVNLYTKGGYKQRVYRDDTTYLLGNGGIALGLVATHVARVALIAAGAGAAGVADATAQPEAGATEERLLVNGEYQWMIENRVLTKRGGTIHQRGRTIRRLRDVLHRWLEAGGGAVVDVAQVCGVYLDLDGLSTRLLLRNRGARLTWWMIGLVWVSRGRAFGLLVLRIIFLG